MELIGFMGTAERCLFQFYFLKLLCFVITFYDGDWDDNDGCDDDDDDDDDN